MVSAQDLLLKKIVESMIITDNQIRWEGSIVFELGKDCSLLLSEVMLDNKILKKMNSARYYFSTINNLFSSKEFVPIFKRLKERGEYDFTKFIKEIESDIDKINLQSKTKKFELYYPINIKISQQIEKIKIKDVLLEIKTFSDLNDIFEDNNFQKEFESEKFTKSKYEYIKLEMYARNSNYAVEYATKFVYFFIGLISYFQKYNLSTLTLIGEPKPLSELRLNYIIICAEGSYSGYQYFSNKSDENKTYDLKQHEEANLNKFIDVFNKTDKRLQDILFQTFDLYYHGLIEKDVTYSFLNFWICLEVISLKKRGVKHDEIINRVKSIIKNLTPIDIYKLDRIHNLRNDFVHDGGANSKITTYDRDTLKSYVELFIRFFVFEISMFSINEIQEIFRYLPKNNNELENNKKLIDFVIKLKGDVPQ